MTLPVPHYADDHVTLYHADCLDLLPLMTPKSVDAFAGSGTTGLAARMEGRRAILIERELRYADVAAERLSRMPSERGGQTVLFAEGK